MKNRVMSFLTARNSKWNLASGILVLLVLVLGCGDAGDAPKSAETEKKGVPSGYVGIWTAADGATVTLRADGTGDYKTGGSVTKSVNGATVEVDEMAKEIRFTLLGFDSGKYKIDQPPAGNKMMLDGAEYRRTGGLNTGDPNKIVSENTDQVPSEDALRPIVARSLKEFNAAVQKGDFGEFYAGASQLWQSQTTVVEMDKAFVQLIKEKWNFEPKSEASLAFSPKPGFAENNVLVVMVNYPSVENDKWKFRLRYVKEFGDWKLLGIHLNPKS